MYIYCHQISLKAMASLHCHFPEWVEQRVWHNEEEGSMLMEANDWLLMGYASPQSLFPREMPDLSEAVFSRA